MLDIIKIVFKFLTIFYYGILTLTALGFLIIIILALYRAFTIYPKQSMLSVLLVFGVGYIVNIIISIIK